MATAENRPGEGEVLLARVMRAFGETGIEEARVRRAIDDAVARGSSAPWRDAYKTLPPFSALFAGAVVPVGAYAVVDYLTASCATMADGMAQMARYFRLVRPDVTIRLSVNQRVARVDFETESRDDWFFDEWTVGITVQRFRASTGREFRLEEARFRRPVDQGGQEARVRAHLGCDAVLGATHGGFSVSSDVWLSPLVLRDERMRDSLEAHADRLLRAHQDETTALRARMRDVVARPLREGDASVQTTAKTLGMTSRTLQRRLAGEGGSHAAIVEGVRAELADRYLDSERLSVTEVAFLLGYSDASAFARAYKRWRGKSPAESRRAR